TQFLFHDGLERFAGHYDENLGTLADYLAEDTLVIVDQPGKLADRAEELAELIEREYKQTLQHFPGVSPPAELYLPAEAFAALRREYPGADWMDTVESAGASADYDAKLFIDCRPSEPVQRSIEKLKAHLGDLAASAIDAAILCDNAGQKDRLFELLGDQ